MLVANHMQSATLHYKTLKQLNLLYYRNIVLTTVIFLMGTIAIEYKVHEYITNTANHFDFD